MTLSLVETAPAKINLTLRVLGRRADGYHELESLVAFADFGDTLTLLPGATLALDVSGPFAMASGKVADNLVLKAVAELRASRIGLKAGHFLLEKNLPVAAGLGGGSADAAAALRLLARLNHMAHDDSRIVAAARRVGADVPACLASRPRVMTGIGEQLSAPLDLPQLWAVLVNPGVPLATRDVFARFTATDTGANLMGNIPHMQDALIDFLKQHDNDLTPSAIACEPAVGDVLMTLRAVPGARLARMTGSGSTCFALFATSGEAASAARRLEADYKDWWVKAVSLGSGPLHP